MRARYVHLYIWQETNKWGLYIRKQTNKRIWECAKKPADSIRARHFLRKRPTYLTGDHKKRLIHRKRDQQNMEKDMLTSWGPDTPYKRDQRESFQNTKYKRGPQICKQTNERDQNTLKETNTTWKRTLRTKEAATCGKKPTGGQGTRTNTYKKRPINEAYTYEKTPTKKVLRIKKKPTDSMKARYSRATRLLFRGRASEHVKHSQPRGIRWSSTNSQKSARC